MVARALVASATNLSLGTRKLPNAPASEFTSSTTTTGNVNTYARNDMATRTAGYTHTHRTYTRTSTKMRIHFLQNVSHSAAHYRRNEKGMMRGGNSNKEGHRERERGQERRQGTREEKETDRVGRRRRPKGQGGGRRRERTEGRRTEGEASLNIS